MTQRQVSHPVGELPGCVPECGRTPKHFLDKRRASAGGGHALECACERRTPKRATFEEARADWLRLTGQTIPVEPPQALAAVSDFSRRRARGQA